jgi:N-acetylmuramoyl-L-alanine amidase
VIHDEKRKSHPWTRREPLTRATILLLLILGPSGLFSAAKRSPLSISNRLSPLNSKRPRRRHTRYIVLHTTEGNEAGSLAKVVRFGEAHYFVTNSGHVYRIIDKDKIAKHAGRSMWEGRTAIDNWSIGIEVEGYHNKDIKEAQYTALRELLRQLKALYHITDKNVLTHSMVAYGRPNRFHNENHRGRKRCGMIFARPDVRERLGLESKPAGDLDVESGRLAVGDRELFSFLFTPSGKSVPTKTASAPVELETPPESKTIDSQWTAWKIARERYNQPTTVYVFPDGQRVAGDQIRDWGQIPYGTQVLLNEMDDPESFEGFLEIGKDGDSPKAIAGTAWKSDTTIYFFPDGLIRTGAELQARKSWRKLLENPPRGTRLLVGYVYGGHVKSRRPPATIAGEKWNYPSTYYRKPDGSIVSGDDVDTDSLPAGTLIFYQR